MLARNAVSAAQKLLLPYLAQARTVLDATAGNGNDTLFLARHTQATAKIWAFDIQFQAINKTREVLTKHNLNAKVQLVQTAHERLPQIISEPLDVVMFNLGYLPGGDHSIITCAQTTITAVTAAAKLLSPGGVMTVVVYPGHPGGKLEQQLLAEFLPQLPQKLYSVLLWQTVNQINQPPLLYAIEKKGDR